MTRNIGRIIFAVPVAIVLSSCGGDEEQVQVVRTRPASTRGPAPTPTPIPDEPGKPKREPQSGHQHDAPHGGALVVIGDHLAHLEVVFEGQNGLLTFYFLDAEANGAVRLADESIPVIVRPLDGDGLGSEHEVTMIAIENPLTGETRGATSQYEGVAPKLKGTNKFDVVIPRLLVRGLELTDFTCAYPDGNESSGGAEKKDQSIHEDGDAHEH